MNTDIKSKTIEELVEFLEQANKAYRAGKEIISDHEYDHIWLAELTARDPKHPYLQAVEPEPESMYGKNAKVRHPSPMLSTDKAYTREEVEKFISRINKCTEEIGVTEYFMRVTPKLDGMAARYENDLLVSRGDGLAGYVLDAFSKGVIAQGGVNTGIGEIVMDKNYFDQYLAEEFSHPRNVVVGAVGADVISNPAIQSALDAESIRFIPYSELTAWEGPADQLILDLDSITAEVRSCDYPVDGVIIEVTDPAIKAAMGSNNQFNLWQIAKKEKGETGRTVVLSISWQTGRTGRVTPVLEVEPTSLSGATIRRVTAHHAGMIKKLGINRGAEIEIIRSGDVIPKIESVINIADAVDIPVVCPSCGSELTWENDFIVCENNIGCPAQVKTSLVHFFNILGNVDLFGPKTIEKLVKAGFSSLENIYAMTEDDFVAVGLGPKQAENTMLQLQRSRFEEVDDWRFLAAFGIHHLGKGDSKKLLRTFAIDSINELTEQDLTEVNGFGAISSPIIIAGIKASWSTIKHLLGLGFNLRKTELQQQTLPDGVFSGKHLVFSGKMPGSREAMKAEAEMMGAVIQASVNNKTDFLVTGEKVGAKKVEKAQALGTKVMTISEYQKMIQDPHGE